MKLFRIIQFLLLVLFIQAELNGQRSVDQVISINVESQKLVDILYDIQNEYELTIYFEPLHLPTYPLTANFDEVPLFRAMQDFTNGTSLKFFQDKLNRLFLVRQTLINEAYLSSLVGDWSKGRFYYPKDAPPDTLYFKSKLSDEINGEAQLIIEVEDDQGYKVIGATLATQDYSITEVSDSEGLISLNLAKQDYQFELSSLNHKTQVLYVSLLGDLKINTQLETSAHLLDEIEISAASMQQQLHSTDVGKEIVDLERIESLPQVLGETDVIKSLELLPGVTSGSELSTGFNVRGGDIDENLVLLDDAMIFNPTHIVGFISAINSDIIDQTNLYKSHINPQYGGRISSLLDIKSDLSDNSNWKLKGGLGVSLLKLTYNNRIGERFRYRLGGRGSFNNFLLKRIANLDLQRSRASFYDFNLNLRYLLSNRQKLSFKTYGSNDDFQYSDNFGLNWSNNSYVLGLKSQWSDQLFSSVKLISGSYNSRTSQNDSSIPFQYTTGIGYNKVLTDLSFNISENAVIKWGYEFIDYSNEPEKFVSLLEFDSQANSIQRKSSISNAFYLNLNRRNIGNLAIDVGLRYSLYNSQGPGNLNLYADDQIEENAFESVVPLNGVDDQGKYTFLEPRVSFSYSLNDYNALKFSFVTLSQNIFQITNSNSSLPTDIWMFSDRYIDPSLARQYSLGYKYVSVDNSMSIGVDGFYKQMENLLELDDFTSVPLNDQFELDALSAKGESFGFELQLNKRKGKLTGMCSYTFTRSFREITESGHREEGLRFPSSFDIPQQLNVLFSYKWLPVLSLNLSYSYKSGRPVTIPSATIYQNGYLVPLYSERWQGRMPHFSRVDFSLNIDLRKSSDAGVRSSFSFGLYNLFARRNPSNLFFRRSDIGNIQAFQFAVVGAMIPSISWNFIL